MTRTRWTKDPEAVLDYSWDWQHWLEAGETITAASVTVPAGLTKDSESNNTTSVTVWLSGGTAGESYAVTCEIETTEGRTDQRSITILVRDR